jgi:hypothetical protein
VKVGVGRMCTVREESLQEEAVPLGSPGGGMSMSGSLHAVVFGDRVS